MGIIKRILRMEINEITLDRYCRTSNINGLIHALVYGASLEIKGLALLVKLVSIFISKKHIVSTLRNSTAMGLS